MNIPQAARELAIKLSRYLHEDSGYDDLIPDITAALKRCRNEALEEAIAVCEKDADKFHAPDRISGCLWSAAGIRALAQGGEKV